MSPTAWTVTGVTGGLWLTSTAVACYWWAQTRRDELTGLGNRARLAALAARAARSGRAVGVALADVDHFKAINDTCGHRFGDRVLCAIADRLAGATLPGEQVVRLHGDEFLVWLGHTRPAVARRRAVELSAALADPIRVDTREVSVSISVGAATGVVGPGGLGEVLERADMAMYEAKRTRPEPGGQPLPAGLRLRDITTDTARPGERWTRYRPATGTGPVADRFSVLGGER